MEKTKKAIRYEFLEFSPNFVTGRFSQTLVLNNPASVKFVYVGNGGVNDRIVINNVYTLEPLRNFLLNTSINPYELILNNNIDEIDKTIYSIQIFGTTAGCMLKVIVKYYDKY
jgi:hypothetical protein